MNTKKRTKSTKINKVGKRLKVIDSNVGDRDINSIIAEVKAIASHAKETLRRCAKRSILCDEELKLRIQVGVHDLGTIGHVLKQLEL